MASSSNPLPQRCPDLEDDFPKLRELGYAITSPKDFFYNCVAWAADRDDERWWPIDDDDLPPYVWPDGCWDDDTLAAFVFAFRSLGYSARGSRVVESGFEKVAIFTAAGIPTHVARQLPSGAWTSKIGSSYDIEHPLGALEGVRYGAVQMILRRAR
jgi:hypothetical protein